MPATILAFDGVLFDTLPARCAALRDALGAEGLTPVLSNASASLEALMAGCTFAEVVGQLQVQASDPIAADLVVLRAQRVYAAIVAHGVPILAAGMRIIREAQAAGHRLVVRSDSDRPHVESLLTLGGLDASIGIVRCADDPPRGMRPSLERSWVAIDERLDRLGIPAAARVACEASEVTLAAAAAYIGTGTVTATR